jgi:hypothetical protein
MELSFFSTDPFCRELVRFVRFQIVQSGKAARLLMSTAEPSPLGITRSWSRWLGKNAAGRFSRQPVFLGRIFRCQYWFSAWVTLASQ